MKKRYYAYIGMLCSLLVFAGCDKESITPETGEKVPITLSAPSLPVSIDIQTLSTASSQGIQTRAETINDRSIGVVAVNTVEGAGLDTLNWSNYYLDHVGATGTNTDLNDEKAVTFASTQWWPFHATEYLAFVAYSPYYGSNGDNRVTRDEESNTLRVTSNETGSFPDFVYTTPVGPWNKETAKTSPNKAVSLGVFQHAMAKLDIKVILVDKDGNTLPPAQYPNPNRIRITELKVSTTVNSAQFDLIQPTTPKTWVLDADRNEQTVRTHISSSTTLTDVLPTYTGCFLLPGTENDSYVSIKIQELAETGNTVINDISRKARINEFALEPSGTATLEMGKTTLLTIKVKYVPIPDPETSLILEGQLVEWDYKGESTVTIE